MLYFVLVSLFSADTLVDAESCRHSLEGLKILKRDFETSKLKDDAKLRSLMEDAGEIISRDLKEFEEAKRNKEIRTHGGKRHSRAIKGL